MKRIDTNATVEVSSTFCRSDTSRFLYRLSRCAGGHVTPLDWADGSTCWTESPSYVEAVRPQQDHLGRRASSGQTTGGTPHADKDEVFPLQPLLAAAG